MADTLANLRTAQRALARIERQRDTRLAERNRLIVEAVREGKTHQQLADAMGVSRSRAGQLAQAALKHIAADAPTEEATDYAALAAKGAAARKLRETER